MKVQAYVDGSIHFDASEVDRDVMQTLTTELTFPNPKYEAALHFGGSADGIAEYICLMECRLKEVVIPRGAVHLFRRTLEAAGYEVTFENGRLTPAVVDYRFRFTLRDYQAQAVEALVRHIQGCVVAPCGAGKTVIGVAAIAQACQPALILVHTWDLVEQWRQTIDEALGLPVGVIAGGQFSLLDVTVATIQSLATLDEQARAQVVSRFGTVILDEAHHVPAHSFRNILSWLPAKYRFGLTATPERDDGLTPLLDLCIGPQVFRVKHTVLIEAGHLVTPELVPVFTGTRVRGRRHATCVRALSEDARRNGLIVWLVTQDAQAGCSTLVLSGLRDHCDLLAESLSASGIEAVALTSRVAKKHRPRILERFREGSLKVVCATSLADEGLDVTRLERLVLATPARAEGRTTQRMGRLMRPRAGKRHPKLYDLVDDYPMAQRQFRARKQAYAKVLGSDMLMNEDQGLECSNLYSLSEKPPVAGL